MKQKITINKMSLGALQANCYFLTDNQSGETALIDPASESERIIEYIELNKLKVKYIILTHIHIDHIEALDRVKTFTGAKIAVHSKEAESLNDNVDTMSYILDTTAPCSKADIKVVEGDELLLGNTKLKILHTPGHTVGGICVLCENVLFSGDTLFFESVGRSDFKGGDHAHLILSIKEKLMILPEDVCVYPGHGRSTTVAYEKRFNPFIQ